MQIKVSTAEIQVKTVELSKNVIRQLDHVKNRDLKKLLDEGEFVGRIDSSVAEGLADTYYTHYLVKLDGVYMVWNDQGVLLSEDDGKKLAALPKLIIGR